MFYFGNFSDLNVIRHKCYVRDPWICMRGSYRCLRGEWVKAKLAEEKVCLNTNSKF